MHYSERGAYEYHRLWQLATMTSIGAFLVAVILNWLPVLGTSVSLSDDLFFLDLMSIPLALRLAAAEIARAEMNLASPLKIDDREIHFPYLKAGLMLRNHICPVDQVEGFAVSPPLGGDSQRPQTHRLYLVEKSGTVAARYYPPRDAMTGTLHETVRNLRETGFRVDEGLPSRGLESLRAKIIPRANPVLVIAGFWPGVLVQLVAAFVILQSNLRLGGPISLAGFLLFFFPGLFGLTEWRAAATMAKSSRAPSHDSKEGGVLR